MRKYDNIDFVYYEPRFYAPNASKYEQRLMADSPQTITAALNEAIKRYPDHFFIKTDEDFVITDPVIERILYNDFKKHQPLVSSCLININDFGGDYIVRRFGWEDEAKKWIANLSPECPGPFMTDPVVAEWMWRKTLDLRDTLAKVKANATGTKKYNGRYGVGIMGFTKERWDLFSRNEQTSEEYDIAMYLRDHKDEYVTVATDSIVFHMSPMRAYEVLVRSGIFENVMDQIDRMVV